MCVGRCASGQTTKVGNEEWCYTNGKGQCEMMGHTHDCTSCGPYMENRCKMYPPTTSPDGQSHKKNYDVRCPNAQPMPGNTCIQEKCFGSIFECKEGYVVETTKKKEYILRCEEGEYQWPKCVDATCTPRDAPHATPISTDDLTFGRELLYVCDPGFGRFGNIRSYTAKCVIDANGEYVLDDVGGCVKKGSRSPVVEKESRSPMVEVVDALCETLKEADCVKRASGCSWNARTERCNQSTDSG
eukprot:GEMP01064935.1.p1 GENE.GEMP01064935.1~~GEMP01064935.1.p1  ORF type:complete len:243 (+),score=46.37 GEMP01064935.1:228-956(+)